MSIIQITNLTKKYGNIKVLKNIDLEIQEGDFFALLWHNGAWKTTIISILTNLVNKNSWKVKINGIDIDKNFKEARKYIWVVPQEFNFDIFAKVMDIPLIQAWYYGVPLDTAKERVEYYLKKLWLWEKRNAKARELSGWMKRRLMIVRALIHKPKILILDEPTAWVDVELRKSMWKFIQDLNKNGTTILLTTHYLEEVETLCKKVAIIHEGRIVENTTTKKLLSKLNKEVIIIDTLEEVKKIPKELVKKYKATAWEDSEIEITVSHKYSLNELFSDLGSFKIKVKSFRNKANRLEQLFIKLIK
jgi:ABC-2 type transport system ATP-binding protein